MNEIVYFASYVYIEGKIWLYGFWVSLFFKNVLLNVLNI